jgi:hypothetical protein
MHAKTAFAALLEMGIPQLRTKEWNLFLPFGGDFDSGITASVGDACAPSSKPEECE